MLPWLLIAAGAAAERLRGGYPSLGVPGSDDGAGKARALRAAVWALVALATILQAGAAPLIVAAVVLWTAVGAFLAMANSHADCWLVNTAGQAAKMLVLGLLRYSLSAGPLLAWGVWETGDLAPLWSLAVAVAHPALYWLCWRLPLPRLGRALDAPSAYAEYGWGGAQMTALVAVLA